MSVKANVRTLLLHSMLLVTGVIGSMKREGVWEYDGTDKACKAET